MAKAKPKKKAASGKRGRPAAEPKGLAKGGPEAEVPGDTHLETVLSEVTAVPEKKHMDQMTSVQCPYCDDTFEIHITSADDGQMLEEECHACARTVTIHVHAEEDELQVTAYRS